MAIMSLSRFRSAEPAQPPVVNIRACRFERTVMRGGLAEGGVLTCIESGRERRLHVSISWEALAQLRMELTHRGALVPDEVIISRVLRHWGVEEFRRRLLASACLAQEGLLLDCLGGPYSSRPRVLLQACGLLPPDAA